MIRLMTTNDVMDEHGERHEVGVSDDPRLADADDIARFTDAERRRGTTPAP